jgi:hypothetical protein
MFQSGSEGRAAQQCAVLTRLFTPPTHWAMFTLRVGVGVIAGAVPERDAVADGDLLRSDEDVFDEQSQHALPCGHGGDVFGKMLWVSAPDIEGECCSAFGGSAAAQALIAGGYRAEQDILKSCGAASLNDVTTEAVANYCRNGKVPAAIALTSQLDAATAAKIASVNGLLQRLVDLDTNP